MHSFGFQVSEETLHFRARAWRYQKSMWAVLAVTIAMNPIQWFSLIPWFVFWPLYLANQALFGYVTVRSRRLFDLYRARRDVEWENYLDETMPPPMRTAYRRIHAEMEAERAAKPWWRRALIP